MYDKRRKDINKYLGQATNASEVTGDNAFRRAARVNRPIPKRRGPTRERGIVAGYRDSMVGSSLQYREVVPGQLNKVDAATNTATPDVVGNRPVSGATEQPRISANPINRSRHFIEPPKRGFNPYS